MHVIRHLEEKGADTCCIYAGKLKNLF